MIMSPLSSNVNIFDHLRFQNASPLMDMTQIDGSARYSRLKIRYLQFQGSYLSYSESCVISFRAKIKRAGFFMLLFLACVLCSHVTCVLQHTNSITTFIISGFIHVYEIILGSSTFRNFLCIGPRVVNRVTVRSRGFAKTGFESAQPY